MTLTPDVPLTPPPAASAAAPYGPPPTSGAPLAYGAPGSPTPPPRRSSARIVSILAICAGAVLVLGTVATGIVSVVRTSVSKTGTASVDGAGLSALDIDAGAAKVTVLYGGGTEATLRVTGGSGVDDWRFERSGDVLVVSSDRDWFGRWGWFGEPETVELTLPLRSEGMDADISVSSGSLDARGGFGDLDLTLDAGSLRIDGRADTLDLDVNAGSANFDLAGVTTAGITVNAGSVEGRLGESIEDFDGETIPSSILLDVSAGRIDLTVPDVTYALTSDVSAGGFTHDLQTSPASDHRIGVSVAAGGVTLRAAG